MWYSDEATKSIQNQSGPNVRACGTINCVRERKQLSSWETILNIANHNMRIIFPFCYTFINRTNFLHRNINCLTLGTSLFTEGY